jgi:predicted translation initiation factor SUI1
MVLTTRTLSRRMRARMSPVRDARRRLEHNMTMKPKQTFRGAVIRSTGTARPPQLREIPADGSRVRVSREVAGRGGKGVSVITGLPLQDAGLEALATQLKKSCGAGGAVRDGRIEIQGDHRDRLVAELTKLGYAAKRSGG